MFVKRCSPKNVNELGRITLVKPYVKILKCVTYSLTKIYLISGHDLVKLPFKIPKLCGIGIFYPKPKGLSPKSDVVNN